MLISYQCKSKVFNQCFEQSVHIHIIYSCLVSYLKGALFCVDQLSVQI